MTSPCWSYKAKKEKPPVTPRPSMAVPLSKSELDFALQVDKCFFWLTRWWFQIFLEFSPPIWGRNYQFDDHIFQMGWFNHQPVKVLDVTIKYSQKKKTQEKNAQDMS